MFGVLIAGCIGVSPAPLVTGPDMASAAPAPHCNNGIADKDETDVDCGGSCAPCDTGRACLKAADCLSALCTNKTCAAAACTDNIKNGRETDVDCGGGACPGCAVGKSCVDGPDCASTLCTNGVCVAAPCANGKQDGLETDIDCGGGACPKCDVGKKCAGADDCTTGHCTNGLCVVPLNCMAGTADCDGNPMNGCEAMLGSDPRNCGACKNACGVNLPYCFSGKCINRYSPVGIQKNIAVKDLSGWTQCFLNLYSDKNNTTVQMILQGCSKKNLLLACRQTGSPMLSLLAWAPRTDVLVDTGAMKDGVTHTANGVAWYFNESWSWGFAPPGDMVFKNSCDGGMPDLDLRLCWHTGLQGPGSFSEGFRCGDNSSDPNWLNRSNAWERLIYQAD